MEENDYGLFGDVVNYVKDDLLGRGIPEDVVWVMMMEMYYPYVGSEVMDRINNISK